MKMDLSRRVPDDRYIRSLQRRYYLVAHQERLERYMQDHMRKKQERQGKDQPKMHLQLQYIKNKGAYMKPAANAHPEGESNAQQRNINAQESSFAQDPPIDTEGSDWQTVPPPKRGRGRPPKKQQEEETTASNVVMMSDTFMYMPTQYSNGNPTYVAPSLFQQARMKQAKT